VLHEIWLIIERSEIFEIKLLFRGAPSHMAMVEVI